MHGHHVYKEVWNEYTVVVTREHDTVAQVSRAFSTPCNLLLKKGGSIHKHTYS